MDNPAFLIPSGEPRRRSVAGDLSRLRRHGRLRVIGLALPLPFGNVPFALGIVLIALGLLTRDGLGTLAGHFVGIASMALFVTLGIGLIRAGTDLTDWLLW